MDLMQDSESNPEIDLDLEELRRVWSLDDKDLMYHVDRGMKGLNKGLFNGMKRLNEYIYGTHTAMYYLIGADSGVGKTTLADFMYVYNLYTDAKVRGIPVVIDYYSWEISIIMKKAKWASLLYQLKYGTTIPAQYIIGRIDGMHLTSVEYQRIAEISKEINEMFSVINFIEDPATPLDIWRRIVKRAEQYGEVVRAVGHNKESTTVIGYHPREGTEGMRRITMIDHLALLDVPSGSSLKQAMDTTSIFLARARNLFGDTTVVIQQFNTELQSAARDKKDPVAYKPTRQDFGDSKYTYRDADVVMGLMKPTAYEVYKYGSFTNLERWGNYFIINHLSKNRYGAAGVSIPMFVNHMAGIPIELPDSKGWDSVIQDYYIDQARKLDEINAYYTPKTEDGTK